MQQDSTQSKGGDSIAEEEFQNLAVLSLEHGRLHYEDANLREELEEKSTEKLKEDLRKALNYSRGRVELVEVKFVVYNDYESGFTKKDREFSSKEEAEEYLISRGDVYTDPRTNFQGTLEKEIEVVE